MVDVSRRGFLTQVSVATGVGIAAGLGVHKLLAPVDSTPDQGPPPMPGPLARLDNVQLAGPMLVHVRDVPTGEIAMMVGTQELVYRDPELVSRLVRTAASVGTQGG